MRKYLLKATLVAKRQIKTPNKTTAPSNFNINNALEYRGFVCPIQPRHTHCISARDIGGCNCDESQIVRKKSTFQAI